MDVPGSAYLFTLAVIAITFVGFTAIVVILRQSVGGVFLPIDALVARLFMVQGFTITFASLLPPALAEYELASSLTWGIACVVTGLAIAILNIGYGVIRVRVTGRANPLHVWLHIVVSEILALLFLLAGFGALGAHAAAIATTLLTLYLVQVGFAFVQHFGFMLGSTADTE